jgi:CHAT domain-containing protein
MIILNILTANCQDYIFSIRKREELSGPTVQQTIRQETRRDLITFFQSIAETCNRSRGPSANSNFEMVGNLLFEYLPPEIKTFLEHNPEAPLLIKMNDNLLPWELVFDKTNFLSLSRPVSRMLMLPFSPLLPIEQRGEGISILIIANPTRDQGKLDLPAADDEAAYLCDLLTRQKCRVDFLGGPEASKFKVIQHLRGTYDIIHYCGHAEMGEDQEGRECALILSRGEKLFSSEIRRFLCGSPIVFLNACHTIRGDREMKPDAEHLSANHRGSQDLADAFILGNQQSQARAFLGTLWRTEDSSSRDFSSNFYQNLLAGQMIGEAVRRARLKIQSHNNATWAAFILYGDPGLIPFQIRAILQRKSLPETLGIKAAEEPPLVPSDITASPFPGTVSEIVYEGNLYWEKLGNSAREVLYYARQEMAASNINILVTTHLFIGLARIENGYTQAFLITQADREIPEEKRPQWVQHRLRESLAGANPSLEVMGLSARLLSIFRIANIYAELDKRGTAPVFIEEKHILQGFFENINKVGGGLTEQVLQKSGIRIPTGNREAIRSLPLFDISRSRMEYKELDLRFYLDRLSPAAQEAFATAVRETKDFAHNGIMTPHLMIGLTMLQTGLTPRLFEEAGISPMKIRDRLRLVLGIGNRPADRQLLITRRLQDILINAYEYAEREKPFQTSEGGKMTLPVIDECHLLEAILKNSLNDPQSLTALVLQYYGLGLQPLISTITGPHGRKNP